MILFDAVFMMCLVHDFKFQIKQLQTWQITVIVASKLTSEICLMIRLLNSSRILNFNNVFLIMKHLLRSKLCLIQIGGI